MIKYRFNLARSEPVEFEVDLDSRQYHSSRTRPPAEWTKLSHSQCRNCPLEQADNQYCPAALYIERAAERFTKVVSYEEVEVEVQTPNRTYTKKCDAQSGLQSLIGLLMASSACPITARLKGLAAFHLPFASPEETLFRSVGAHLIKQYFRKRRGLNVDLDLHDLDELYSDLEIVNESFMKRIQSASERDCNLNAVYALMALGLSVRFSLEDQLSELEAQFG